MKAALLFVLVCISCAYARNISDFHSKLPFKNRTKRSLFYPVEFVNAHNMVRERVYPPPSDEPSVNWDEHLAISAQYQADNFMYGDSAAMPMGPTDQRFAFVGTNVVLIESFSAMRAVLSWESEKDYYNYTTNSCDAGHVCGHYTQVVWHDSTKIGCGIKDYSTSDDTPPYATLVVCLYGPGTVGNVNIIVYGKSFGSIGPRAIRILGYSGKCHEYTCTGKDFMKYASTNDF